MTQSAVLSLIFPRSQDPRDLEPASNAQQDPFSETLTPHLKWRPGKAQRQLPAVAIFATRPIYSPATGS